MSYKLNIVAKDSLVNHFSAQDGSLEYSWKLMTKMFSCSVVSSMNIVLKIFAPIWASIGHGEKVFKHVRLFGNVKVDFE
jgi:hypothetical protein